MCSYHSPLTNKAKLGSTNVSSEIPFLNTSFTAKFIEGGKPLTPVCEWMCKIAFFVKTY